MSYTIIYDYQFIKIGDDKYIPVLLAGASNCWDCNNKCDRSWYNANIYGAGILSEQDMYDNFDAKVNASFMNSSASDNDLNIETYKQQLGYYWGTTKYGSKNCTYQILKNYIKNGIKHALTFDELKRKYVNVSVKCKHINSEKELIKTMKNGDLNLRLVLTDDGIPKRLRKVKREIKQKDFSKGYYSIEVYETKSKSMIGFLIRNTKFGFRYSYTEAFSVRYDNLVSAKRAVSNFNKRNIGHTAKYIFNAR